MLNLRVWPAPKVNGSASTTDRAAEVNGSASAADTPVLMLGKGWFPEEAGGLDRYYRDLLEHLPEARGVVIGGREAPDRVASASDHDRPLPLRLFSFWQAAQRAASDADVIDAHFALYSLFPLWVGRLRHKPVVVHFQGPWADESVASGDSSRLRLAIRRRLERAAYCRADQCIVLTSAFRQVLVERYGISPWKVNVEPPGVDLRRFVPDDVASVRRRLGIPERAFVAVAVRRLVRRMGLDVLIDAWADRLAELPPNSLLFIAGDGPEREQLAAQIEHRGLSGSVVLLGKVSEEDLVALYQAADVNVIPSLAHEGFGLVALEAAACGTPSIVTAVGGLPEAISGLDPSLIVPPGDVNALGERLLRARVALPGAVASRAYAEGFNWERVAARHRQIAGKAMGRGGPARHRVGRPFRVVYLDHVAQLSGGEIALMRLLPHLDRVEPHVILAEDGPLVGRLNMEGISTEVMEMRNSGRGLRKDRVRAGKVPVAALGASAAYVLALAARLRRLSPDLVHTNSMKAGVYGSLAAKLAGVPMIWHVRDHIDDSYLPPQAVRLIRQMTRHLPTAVVANSRSTMETLRAPQNPVVIYSVLPEVLSAAPRRKRATTGPLTFGVVGRLAPWKGQDFFMRAFANAFPVGDERAAIVGGALFGEDEYAGSLPALAHELGIADRVDLRGHRGDVWDELSRLDVLVHSSISPEPFGQVILEGMAAGVPVIAAGAGGPAEILSDRVTGILYPPNDIGGLSDAMRSMHDQQLRDRLTVAARDALGPYSPAVVAAQLQTVYSAVVARTRR